MGFLFADVVKSAAAAAAGGGGGGTTPFDVYIRWTIEEEDEIGEGGA